MSLPPAGGDGEPPAGAGGQPPEGGERPRGPEGWAEPSQVPEPMQERESPKGEGLGEDLPRGADHEQARAPQVPATAVAGRAGGSLAGDGVPPVVGGASPLAPIGPERDRVHMTRLHLMWALEMAIAEPCLWFFLYKHLPPGAMTSSANGVRFDTIVAVMLANAAVAAVLIYGGYVLVNWRHPKGEPIQDGPPLRSHYRVQFLWVFITAGIVIGAFVFGTYELIVPNGAGGGEGPSPIWTPSSKNVLPIQVIGQQWYWTYRYPTFGGFETTQLMVPEHTSIAFHVTSLDVVHDWWAYQLSIKADANPGVDNVAFTTTGGQLGRMVVRCDELCGIWHGAMYNYGYVVTKAAFMSWGRTMERKLAPLTALLPKFAWTYVPSANGASGGYYPTGDPFYQYYRYYAGYAGREGNEPAVHVKPSNTPASRGQPSGKANPFPVASTGAASGARPGEKPTHEKPGKTKAKAS